MNGLSKYEITRLALGGAILGMATLSVVGSHVGFGLGLTEAAQDLIGALGGAGVTALALKIVHAF